MKSNEEKLIELLAANAKLEEALYDSRTIEIGSAEHKKIMEDWWDRYKKTLVDVLRDVAYGKASLPKEAAQSLAIALEESILTVKTPELFKSLRSKTSEPYELLYWKKAAFHYMVLAEQDGYEALKEAKKRVVENYGVDIRTANNWLKKFDRKGLSLSKDDDNRDWVNLMFFWGGVKYPRLAPPRKGSR